MIRLSSENLKVYFSGSADGIIWGGNLSTIASLCGLDFIPNQDFIFFAEDLNEPEYKIDRYFTQLLNIKEFRENLKAVVLGEFLDCGNCDDFFINLANELKIPFYGKYKISHSDEKFTVPIGGSASLVDGNIEIKF